MPVSDAAVIVSLEVPTYLVLRQQARSKAGISFEAWIDAALFDERGEWRSTKTSQSLPSPSR